MISWVWILLGVFGGMIIGFIVGLSTGDRYWSKKFNQLSGSVDDIMKIYEIDKKEEKEFTKDDYNGKW